VNGAGDCPKLPFVVWDAAGVALRKQDAITNYRYYARLGRIQSGTPSIGAVVFFNITSLGHEAVYIGNGVIASTKGVDGNQLANIIAPLSGFSNYLGYYQPA
jgi:cell wall-associated NlpC family hydrolase